MWKPKMNIKRSAAGSHSHAIKKKAQMKWKEVDMQRPTPRFVSVQFFKAKYSEKWFTQIYRAFDEFRSHVGSRPCGRDRMSDCCGYSLNFKTRLQNSRIFFSKSVKKLVKRGVRASFQTFCLTSRACLNKQKYGQFCSLLQNHFQMMVSADSA